MAHHLCCVQVFAAEGREAGAFEALDSSGYRMARRYAFFQVTPGCRPVRAEQCMLVGEGAL